MAQNTTKSGLDSRWDIIMAALAGSSFGDCGLLVIVVGLLFVAVLGIWEAVRGLPPVFPLNKRLRPWIGGVGIASGALLFLVQECAPPAPVLFSASITLVCAQVIAATLLFPGTVSRDRHPSPLRRGAGGEVLHA